MLWSAREVRSRGRRRVGRHACTPPNDGRRTCIAAIDLHLSLDGHRRKAGRDIDLVDASETREPVDLPGPEAHAKKVDLTRVADEALELAARRVELSKDVVARPRVSTRDRLDR